MLKVALCDDDKQSLDTLRLFLEEYRKDRVQEFSCTPFSSAFALLSAIECGQHFDVAILDVLMPNTNGIQAAEEIRRRDQEMQLVFCSSSREYAVDSYSVKARNYVLKPVEKQKFFAVLDDVFGTVSSGPNFSFWIRDKDGGISRVAHNRLEYCEVNRKEIVLYLSDGRAIACTKALIDLMKLLEDDERFFQTHRSFLVNMDFVQRVTKTEVILTGGKAIPLSRAKASQAMEVFINRSFQTILSTRGGHLL